MTERHPYRPLFVEVPRETTVPRFGVLDMAGLTPMIKALYPNPPPLSAPQVRARSDDPA